MSYRVTISGDIVLEKCIQEVQFYTITSNDCNSKNTIQKLMKITGYIDIDESTVVLYNWALVHATNPDCYKEIIVEQYKSDKLLRKVTFSKAFVVKYTEYYSNNEGIGTFTLYIKQLYAKDIQVVSEESPNSKPSLNPVPKIEKSETREIIKEKPNINILKPANKCTLSFTQRLKNIKSDNITIVNYGEQFTREKRRKVLKPNIEYTSPEGYSYRTDELGRIINCKGSLIKGVADRNGYAQKVVGREDRLPDDEGGHLIASIFKGSGDIDNLVPMNANLNKGEWKRLERTWQNALDEIPPHQVEVEIIPVYKGNSLRPSRFIVEYKIDGKEFSKILENAPGGK